jgi:hypothetical protein
MPHVVDTLLGAMRRGSIFRGAATGFALVIALTLSLRATPGLAAAADSTHAAQVLPELAGHMFIPNSGVEAPFITTHLRSTLGAGRAIDMKVSFKNLDGVIVRESHGDLLYSNLELEYQQRVLRWLAVNAQMFLNGRVGQDAATLLSQGVTGVVGTQLTGLARIAQSRNWMLSGSLGMGTTSVTSIGLLDFAREVADSGKITPDNKIVKTISATRGSVGLRFAHGLNPLLGYTLLAQEGFGDSFVAGKGSVSSYRLGGTVSLDLRPKYRVPIGVLAGYNVNSLAPYGSDVNGILRSFLFQVGYTGRKDFSLSLESAFTKVPLNQNNENLQFNSAQMTMRYFF